MKRGITLFLILLFFAPAVFGQSNRANQKAFELYLNSGTTIQQNPKRFKKLFNKSYNLGIGFGYDLNESYQVITEIGFNPFPLDLEKLASYYLLIEPEHLEGGSANLFTISPGFKWNPKMDNDQFKPFLKGTIGFLVINESELAIVKPDTAYTLEKNSTSSMLFQFGAGLDIKLKERIFIFFETQFDYAFTKDESTSYFPLKVGLRYRK
ncbi:hypothetical protein ACFL7D_06390 [candidate division KSB1 bacterium]